MARTTWSTLHEADPTFAWKLVLRVFSTLLAGAAIGLIAWAQLHTVLSDLEPASDPSDPYSGDSSGGFAGGYSDYSYAYGQDTYELPWEYISLGLSILWNCANIVVWLVPSRSGRGMHPGANVGCDLFLWLILLLTGVIASFDADRYISLMWGDSIGFSDQRSIPDGGVAVDDPNQCVPFASCDAQSAYAAGLKHKGVIIAVGIAFTFLVMLFHFALFISACRYTHARRHEQGGRYAKALTEEATVLAAKMVREMGYAPPGPLPAHEQAHPEAGSVPNSSQTAEGIMPAVGQQQETSHTQRRTPQQQHDTSGKGKGKESDIEQGRSSLGADAMAAGEGSSAQTGAHDFPSGAEVVGTAR